MQFEWSAIWPAIPILLEGAKLTLWISVLGLLGGLIIGVIAGFARAYGGWLSRNIALVFIELIRGTPIVVQCCQSIMGSVKPVWRWACPNAIPCAT